MTNIRIIKELSGHSGCNVRLCLNEDEKLFVRKDAGNVSYNERLNKQLIKQKSFLGEKLKTPKILKYGYVDNVFYFDMEFINGITLAEYMCKIDIKDIADIVTLLFKSLSINESKKSSNAQIIFKEKIESLLKQCDISNDYIKKSFDLLLNFDFSNVPESYCCGDLTLENILLSSTNQLYLIDLLDSFYNSWMIDVAKLLQDIDLGWSYRHMKMNDNLSLRLATAKQVLINNLLVLPDGQNNLKTIYYILLLNVLRIYPYTKDNKTMNFLNNATQKVILTINKMEKNR